MRYITKTANETKEVAARCAKKIAQQKPGRRAVVVGLIGDLGSGKTTFVQGFARALGIRRRMVSPTFTIMRRYRIPHRTSAKRSKHSNYKLPRHRRGLGGRAITNYKYLIHVDAYRVHKPAELRIIKFESWLMDPTAIVLIEWADLVEKKFRRGARIIRFHHTLDSSRTISVP